MRLVLVGGFLGAGKTTLLARATRLLIERGSKVGLVTNDQAPELVDTAKLRQLGEGLVQEVSGGCFCCRFKDLIGALKALLSSLEPDIVLAEPVGSCTDISATVLQPLKLLYGELFELAPYSVLVDPLRLRATTSLPEPTLYIFRKQLEEADIVVLNKKDLLPPNERSSLREKLRELKCERILEMSALRSDGVGSWLDTVLAEERGGTKLTDVDYEMYAEGERLLAWLNSSMRLSARQEPEWEGFCRTLLLCIREGARRRSGEIAHLKLLLATPSGSISGNLTSAIAEPVVSISGDVNVSEVLLVLNARVALEPDELSGLVFACLERVCEGRVSQEVVRLESFAPPAPVPTHRFNRIIQRGKKS